MISLDEQLVKSFVDTAGVRPEFAPDSREDFEARTSPADYCIRVMMRGGVTGSYAMVINEGLARSVSSRILTVAAGRDYPPSEIDDEMAMNTVGEILNIGLGEYYRHRINSVPVDISSPAYGTYGASKEDLARISGFRAFRLEGSLFGIFFDSGVE